jgi:hypothetical protein
MAAMSQKSTDPKVPKNTPKALKSDVALDRRLALMRAK